MRKLEILAVLFVTLLVFSETYVLVIGAGMFDDKSIVPLPGAVKDAQAFKSTILSLGIAKKDNIVYIENPTLAQMKKSILKWVRRATSANDKLILYYSGHGYTKNGDTFLIPRDVAPEFIEDTALNFTKLLERMKDHIKTSNVLMILDTCYAGSLIKDRPLKAIRYEKTELGDLSRHIAFLLSSRGDETSRERPEGGGWFTYYLLKGLEGDANLNGDKYIDIGELYRYVSEKVAKKAEENQHPVLVAGVETMIITEDKKKEYGEILEKIAKLYGHGELDESKYTLYTKILVQSPVQDNEAEDKIRKYIENFYKGNIALDELITLTNMALGKQVSVDEETAVSDHGTKVPKQNSATGFGYLKIIVENPELLEKTDLRISGKLYQVTSEMIKEGVIYLEDVPAGEQVIEIDGPIISRKIVKVNIEPNSLTRVKIRLERAKGSVSIKTEPINAKVYVNGSEYEDRTPTVIKLPTGYYEIKVEKNGYEIEKFYVSVRKNQTKEIMIKLTKIKGKSMYYWIQDEDKVWIKGDWEGEKELWVYYGAVNGDPRKKWENGDEVFEFFDDFEKGSIDTSKWTIESGVWNIVNGMLHTNAGMAYNNIWTIKSFSDFVLSVYVKVVADNGLYDQSRVTVRRSSSSNYVCWRDNHQNPWQEIDKAIDRAGSRSFFIIDSVFYGPLFEGTVEFIVHGTSFYIEARDINGFAYTYSGDILDAPLFGTIGFQVYNHETYYDEVMVRKYSPIEPSVTYGKEETGSWTMDGVTYTKRRKVVVESPVKLENYQIALDYKKFGERSLLIMSY